MKKVLFALGLSLALMFAGVAESSAQVRYGVIGGATFSKLNRNILKGENMTQYHVGGSVQVKLPLGFSIQPSLIYNVKGSKLSVPDIPDSPAADLTVGYLELPVSFQWGPDLLLFRPFLDVTPFVGYGLNNKVAAADAVTRNTWKSSGISRWEYGVGVGLGLEIWKFQIIGRYNWNLGSLADFGDNLDDNGAVSAIRTAFEKGNFGGFTLTAAILF